MRTVLALSLCLGASLLEGCAFVLSHSYSDVTLNRHESVSDTDSTWAFLHLTEPMIENLVVDATHKLEIQCGGQINNVQTKLTMRELLLFQRYEMRVTAQCAAEKSPKTEVVLPKS